MGRCGGFASEMDEGLRRVWSREDGRDVVCSSLWLFPSSKVNPQNCHSRRRARPGAAQLARDQSSCRWIPAVKEDFESLPRDRGGQPPGAPWAAASPQACCRAGLAPRLPAFLVQGFASGRTGLSENWKTSSKNKPTKPLLFCLRVPTHLLRTVFLSYKLPPLALLIAAPPRAPQSLPETETERALCSRRVPWNFRLPAAHLGAALFSHRGFARDSSHSTIDGPTAFTSRN